MTDDEKIRAIEWFHRIKFQTRPTTSAINYLYGEIAKFQETCKELLNKDPEILSKMETSPTRRRRTYSKLHVIENLAKKFPGDVVLDPAR